MDSLFNLVFILIPLAIIIVRTVTHARAKHVKPPPIPVHFEDDEDDEDESIGELGHWMAAHAPEVFIPQSAPVVTAGKGQSPAQKQQKPGSLAAPGLVGMPSATGHGGGPKSPKGAAPKTIQPPAKPIPAPEPGLVNLNHLSPLKQAVVMAEVLGPPKALQ